MSDIERNDARHPLADMKRGIANTRPGKAARSGPSLRLTKSVHDRLIAARGEFIGPESRSLAECAACCNLPARGVKYWLDEGRREVESAWDIAETHDMEWDVDSLSAMARFALDWDRVSALSELAVIRKVREHGQSDPRYWQALAWYVERRKPAVYARPTPTPSQGEVKLTVRFVEADGADWMGGGAVIPGQFKEDVLPAIETGASVPLVIGASPASPDLLSPPAEEVT